MFQLRDPSIKLFGRDIHIRIPIKPSHFTDSNPFSQIQSLPHPFIMNQLEKSTNTELNVPFEELSSKQTDPQDDANGIPSIQENPTPKPVTEVIHRTNEDRTSKREIDPQEKVLKKPDKVLPCPRCNSFETKFCYFNNYNVNQPRHFCKNCQRYWTDGGSIRNIPVGAGKRKNKHPALQYSQVHVTLDAVSVIQTDSNPVSDMQLLASGRPVSPTHLKGIGNIPSLREEAPLSESLQTVLNLKGKTKIEVDSSTVKDDDLVEEPSSSSMKSSECVEKGYSGNGIEKVGLTQHRNGLVPLHSLHYYPAPPWAYQWNPCWNPIALTPSSITSSPAYTGSTAMMAVPSFSTSILELPVAPYSYWGGMPNWDGQKEESSLGGSTFSGIPSPSSSVNGSTCSGNRSPTLGKHSRDGSIPAEDTTKQNLWVPKTVRINDPEEAAKSSIWSTLRTKSNQNKLIMKGCVFKSFEPKSNAGSCVLDDDQILRANPAALARSESFQESM